MHKESAFQFRSAMCIFMSTKADLGKPPATFAAELLRAACPGLCNSDSQVTFLQQTGSSGMSFCTNQFWAW
jgi:hypothetical protein